MTVDVHLTSTTGTRGAVSRTLRRCACGKAGRLTATWLPDAPTDPRESDLQWVTHLASSKPAA
jgi:hypothetical protein